MTLIECYEIIGDYDDAVKRLVREELVERFLLQFPKDKSYEDLCRAMKEGDYQTAFRAAHTIKGVCLNLSLTMLADSIGALTEALRGMEKNENALLLFEKVTGDYKQTIEAIRKL